MPLARVHDPGGKGGASVDLAQALRQITEDHREAANAFVEKRAPIFTAR
jgi:hypothetical protein